MCREFDLVSGLVGGARLGLDAGNIPGKSSIYFRQAASAALSEARRASSATADDTSAMIATLAERASRTRSNVIDCTYAGRRKLRAGSRRNLVGGAL